MPYHIVISRKARRDLEAIADGLADLGPRTVTRWQQRFDRAIDDLTDHPLSYPLAEEFASAEIEVRTHQLGRRRFVYRLFFTVEFDIVRLLRVRHAARDALSEDDL